MYKRAHHRKRIQKKLTVSLLIALLIIGAAAYWFTRSSSDPQPEPVVSQSQPEPQPQNPEPEPQPQQPVEPTPDPEPEPEPEPKWPIVYSLEEAASLTVVVNKKYQLPSTYAPSLVSVAGGQLRSEAATALESLLNAADAAGAPMVNISSYRSYTTQQSTYQYWVDLQGQAEADRSSARPGHSEHQTGLAVDLGNPDGSCRLLACFGQGAAGMWLEQNAHTYGFIIRYPQDKEAVTGYIYEPWHLRYLGVETATAVKNSGQTLEQYYGLEGGGYGS